MAPLAAAWLSHVALVVLLHSRTLRVYDAGLLPSMAAIRNFAYGFAPDALLTASRNSLAGVFTLVTYAVVVCLAIASWCWAVRCAQRTRIDSPWVIVGLTAVVAMPLLIASGMLSDDVYLYHLYGRAIETYGANPIQVAPSAFPHDPHLGWVYWKDLPSSYGPIWLTLSAALSTVAGESITAAVMIHRVCALLLHLATAVAVWFVLKRSRPAEAAAGMIFYAWNPLVLVEIVANAHNDVLVAMFAVLVVAAAAQRAWASAAFFGACAVMVKPFAVLLMPALLLRVLHATRGRSRVRQVGIMGAVCLATIGALSVPLWAGLTLVANISNNPAAHIYTNTLWELLSELGPRWLGMQTIALQHPYLDALRTSCFVVGGIWIMTRSWAARSVAPTALAFWLLFCLTAPWVWPWYFVPAVGFAAITGGRGLAFAAALTTGGLLFWTTWPAPETVWFERLHMWRSAVLFGPVVLTLMSARVRAVVIAAFGTAPAGEAQGQETMRERLAAREVRPDSPAAA